MAMTRQPLRIIPPREPMKLCRGMGQCAKLLIYIFGRRFRSAALAASSARCLHSLARLSSRMIYTYCAADRWRALRMRSNGRLCGISVAVLMRAQVAGVGLIRA